MDRLAAKKPPSSPTDHECRPGLTSMDLGRSVLVLAVPSVARSVLQTVVQMVSLMIVGNLGPAAIAAVGIGNRITLLAIGILSALSVGGTAVVARCIGSGDVEGARKTAVQSILFSSVLGTVICLASLAFGETLVRAMLSLQAEMDTAVLAGATIYVRTVGASFLLGVLLIMVNSLMQGAGDTRTPLYIMSMVNLLNLTLACVLVFGLGPLPGLGVTGAALAAGVSRAAGGLVALFLLFRHPAFRGIRLVHLRRFDWGIVAPILNIGVPSAGENLVRQGSLLLYTALIAGLGTLSIAANAIAMSIQSLSFMPGFGVSIAATTLVGQNLGAGKPGRAERAGYESLRWGLVMAVLAGLLFFFGAHSLVRLYNDDAEVVRLTVVCLRIIAVSQPFLAVVIVLAGGLRGAGDTRYVLFLTAAGNWGIRLLGVYILGFHLGYGLPGVWFAMALDQFARSILTLARFRSGKWKTIRIGAAPRAGQVHMAGGEVPGNASG